MFGIPIEDACIAFGKNFLWEHVFNILSEQIQEYFKRENMVSHKNVDSIVEHHLKYLWEMDEESRIRTSIYKFILDRNHISRSAIHKVVKKMVESGTIKVSNGRLLNFTAED
jgi:DNA-binding MarR family transcriptional regulator